MGEGIRIHDAALEITPSGLEALVRREGAEITVSRLDLSVSPEALATLLAGLAPAGTSPPEVRLAEDGLHVAAEAGGKRAALSLQIGSFRLRISPEGLRLTSEEQDARGADL